MKPLVEILSITDSAQVRSWIAQVGVDPGWVIPMSEKGVFCCLRVCRVPSREANIIKQELLAHGGEAAVNRGCVACTVEYSDVVIMATLHQLKQVMLHLKRQPWGLPDIATEMGLVIKAATKDFC